MTKAIATAVVMLMFLSIFVSPALTQTTTPNTARTIAPNAWGVYVAPTAYEYRRATSQYDLYQSNTGQDIGVFYSRMFARRLSVQIEARTSIRDMDVTLLDVPARVHEQLLQFPLIVHVSNVYRIDERPLRVYIGAGISYRVLFEQKIAPFGDEVLPPGINSTTDAGGFQKMSWVLDGGTAFTYFKRVGVFLSYRLTVDWTTFGESEDMLIVPQYEAYGFQAGFEFRFGGQGDK